MTLAETLAWLCSYKGAVMCVCAVVVGLAVGGFFEAAKQSERDAGR